MDDINWAASGSHRGGRQRGCGRPHRAVDQRARAPRRQVPRQHLVQPQRYRAAAVLPPRCRRAPAVLPRWFTDGVRGVEGIPQSCLHGSTIPLQVQPVR